jgi:hypothetical protein
VRPVKILAKNMNYNYRGIHNKKSSWPCLKVVFQPCKSIEIDWIDVIDYPLPLSGSQTYCDLKVHPGVGEQAVISRLEFVNHVITYSP